MHKQFSKFSVFLNSLKSFPKRRPYLTICIGAAFALHVSIMVGTPMNHPPTHPQHQKLLVKTIMMPATVQTVSRSIKQVRNESIKHTPSPRQPKPINPKPTSKATPPKPSKNTKTKQLLNDLQENIAKIEAKRDNTLPSQAMVIPKPIDALKADVYDIQAEAVELEETSYRDGLIVYLKDALHLPGYGTVKIRLTLQRDGAIQDVMALSSDSEVNRLYLENTLQELIFPPFTEELAGKKTYTFVLTFCSDQ